MNPVPGEIVLDAVEARVVGALVEKAVTTPDYFPLSLNALVNACNQTSNRDPVTAYGETEVKRALESLRDKKLAYVFEGAASRVTKYGHKFAETLGLSSPEVAVLCVLLLRGPQTVGEIRGRTGRLHEFAGLGEVEGTLQALAARAPQPLVVRQPRQTGFKESRYAHLLSGPPEIGAAETLPAEPAGAADGDRLTRLEQEVAGLRSELAGVKAQFAELTRLLG
jgi:uncharacterized protein YceH (UPF0502 family)